MDIAVVIRSIANSSQTTRRVRKPARLAVTFDKVRIVKLTLG
jgi:hypothetical protein